MAQSRRFGFLRSILSLRGAAVAVLLITVAWRIGSALREPAPIPFKQGVLADVARVIDSQTLLLTNGQQVRLLGVDPPLTQGRAGDAPANQSLASEASEFTRRHLEGQRIRLEFDLERQDRDRRVLAYVYVGDWFANEELIRAGWGRVGSQFPFRDAMQRRFKQAERAARQSGSGLWNVPPAAAESP